MHLGRDYFNDFKTRFTATGGRRGGWVVGSGMAEVSCILHHRGAQLILAYSWARPAILLAGKGRGGSVFISPLAYLFLFIPVPLLLLLYCSFYSPFLLETIQNNPQGLTCR